MMGVNECREKKREREKERESESERERAREENMQEEKKGTLTGEIVFHLFDFHLFGFDSFFQLFDGFGESVPLLGFPLPDESISLDFSLFRLEA